MSCRFSKRSDIDCGCANKKTFRECLNRERTQNLEARSDGAAYHQIINDERVYVRDDYCNETHCADFEPMKLCKYATTTKQRWAGDAVQCFVVECRNPQALVNLRSFKESNGVDQGGVRRPCDEKFNLIPNANYLHVRSRFCNREYCPYFIDKENSTNVD